MTALGIALLVIAIIAGQFWIRWITKQSEEDRTALAAAERQAKTQEKINHADLGIGASDGERIKRLREFAAK